MDWVYCSILCHHGPQVVCLLLLAQRVLLTTGSEQTGELDLSLPGELIGKRLHLPPTMLFTSHSNPGAAAAVQQLQMLRPELGVSIFPETSLAHSSSTIAKLQFRAASFIGASPSVLKSSKNRARFEQLAGSSQPVFVLYLNTYPAWTRTLVVS